MNGSSDGFAFEVQQASASSSARCGVWHTPHGPVETPAFMPVGTRGTVRGLWPEQVAETGAEMVLANTYHLWGCDREPRWLRNWGDCTSSCSGMGRS
ncbi:MAG: hypothetical protein CM1200mP2_55080 [Planctomycetaceae bacterium]|nr:MAG: hypothetical protein CM1200mP2_55080 [Planctomycetaceae bacterium]